MTRDQKLDEAIGKIERYALDYPDNLMTVSFPEGDSYECIWDNGEYIDNEEDPSSSTYEEWYELDFHVEKILKPGPNKDPRYEYISISEKHMPSSVTSNGAVLYESKKE
jgi:hypothetical protein